MAGAKVRCYECDLKFIVPEPEPAPPPEPPSQEVPEHIPTPKPRPQPQAKRKKTSNTLRQQRPRNDSSRPRKKRPETKSAPTKAAPTQTPPQKPSAGKAGKTVLIVVPLLLAASAFFLWQWNKNGKGDKRTIQTGSAPTLADTGTMEEESAQAFEPLKEEQLDADADAAPTPAPTPRTNHTATMPKNGGIGFAMDRDLEFKSPSPPEKCLTIHLPLDGSLNNTAGPAGKPLPPQKGKRIYVDGVYGKATRLEQKKGFLNYIMLPNGCLGQKAGTLTMWVRHGEALGAMWGLGMMFAMHEEKNIWAFKWSEHQYKWCLDLFGGGPHSSYALPNHHEWLHFAIVWDRKRKFQRLYVDGKLVSYYSSTSLPEQAFIPEKRILLSCGIGHPKRYVDIDDIRIYSRALSSDEIKAMVEKAAPVTVPLRETPESCLAVYGTPGSTTTFETEALLNGKKPFKGTMELKTLDADDKTIWSGTVALDLSEKHKKASLKWTIPMGETNDIAYLKASLAGWKAKPAWSLELTRVTRRNPSKLSSIQLGKRVVNIDCAAAPNRENYMDNCGAKVVPSKIGKYRETPKKAFSFFSYRFNIQYPQKPHIMRVTYPDDKPRVFALDINDGIDGAPQGSGIQTGLQTRLTNKMLTQDVIFWPGTKNCLLTVCNWGDAPNNTGSLVPFHGESAALAKIEVFEIKNERLPPLRFLKRKDNIPRRNVGMWVEDSSLSQYWGHSPKNPHTLAAWAIASKRLAEYMEHIGADIYQYPVVWYDGAIFQCPTLMAFGESTERFSEAPKGSFATLQATFADTGIKFFPIFYLRKQDALEFQTNAKYDPKKYKNKIPPLLWNERYRTKHPGGDEMLQYYWNGKTRNSPYNSTGLDLPFPGVGPVFNPIHPDVLKIERGMFQDWLDLYGDNPGFGGILLDLGLSWGGLPQADDFSFCRLYGGYGDYTVALFEKETGVKVPTTPNDPSRFKKRFEFLTKGAMRKKWIDWRCREIRDKVVMPLYRMLRKKRPDAVLQIGISSSLAVGSEILGFKTSWQEAAKECGIDLDMYKNTRGITIIRHGVCSQSVTKAYPRDNLDRDWPLDAGNGKTLNNGVCTVTSSYWEMFSHSKLLDPARKKWPETKPNQMPVRTIIDAREGVLAHTAFALMKKDVGEIYIGGMGWPATFGHEDVVRPFFRAFRSLPKVKFDDIRGLEDPVRGRQKTLQGATYAYFINAEPYAVPVTLDFSAPPGEIVNLGTLKRLKLKTTKLKINVPPYQMTAIRFDAASKVVKATPLIPKKEVEALKRRIDNLKREALLPLRMHVPEKKDKSYIWFEAEKWDEWKTKERYSSQKTLLKIDKAKIAFISGNDDIGFGGDGKPTVYKLSSPKAGRYTLWVRFTAPTTTKPTAWHAEINGKKAGQCETSTDWKKLWTKVGVTELPKGPFSVKWFHQCGQYSALVDCFLLTDDSGYTPKGPADYGKRKNNIDRRFTHVDKALKLKQMAKSRALLDATFKKGE